MGCPADTRRSRVVPHPASEPCGSCQSEWLSLLPSTNLSLQLMPEFLGDALGLKDGAYTIPYRPHAPVSLMACRLQPSSLGRIFLPGAIPRSDRSSHWRASPADVPPEVGIGHLPRPHLGGFGFGLR